MSPDNIDTITEPTLAEWRTRALVAERTCHEIIAAGQDEPCYDADGDTAGDLEDWVNDITTANIEAHIPKPPEMLARERDHKPDEQPTDRILVAYGGMKRQGLVIAVVQRDYEYERGAELGAAMAKHLGPEVSKILRLRVINTENDGGPTAMIRLIPTEDRRAMLLNAPAPSACSVHVTHLALPAPSPEDQNTKDRRYQAKRKPSESVGAAIGEVVKDLADGSNPDGADLLGGSVTGRTPRKPAKKADVGSSCGNSVSTCVGCPECAEASRPTSSPVPPGLPLAHDDSRPLNSVGGWHPPNGEPTRESAGQLLATIVRGWQKTGNPAPPTS